MDIDKLKKANYILDKIKQLDFQIKHWSEISIYQVIDSVVLERIDCENTFETFRENLVNKLKEHKKMLEEEFEKV